MKTGTVILLIALWLGSSFGFAYPALNADLSAVYTKDYPQTKSIARHDAAKCMLLGMIPLAGPLIAVFATGFCVNGFKWSMKPTEKCCEIYIYWDMV